MNELELLNLGFKKDTLLSGKETGKWMMPWGGSIDIEENDNIHTILKKAYEIGRESGLLDGKLIGAKIIQKKLKTLLNNPYEGI